MLIFSWGNWDGATDSFPGHPRSIDAIMKLDEDTILTGSSDGLIRVVGIIAGLGCDEDGGDEEAVDVMDGHGERRTSARHQTPDVGDGDQEADGVKLCVPAEADEIAVHGHVGDGDGVEAGGSAARMRERNGGKIGESWGSWGEWHGEEVRGGREAARDHVSSCGSHRRALGAMGGRAVRDEI